MIKDRNHVVGNGQITRAMRIEVDIQGILIGAKISCIVPRYADIDQSCA